MADDCTFAVLLRELRTRMLRAGVDTEDAAAVRRWLRAGRESRWHPRPVGRVSALPPVRLAPGEVLADRARRSRRLWEIYRLRAWVEHRRPVLRDGALLQADAAALAEEFGLRPELAGHRRDITAADPALRRLWLAAQAGGVIRLGPEGAVQPVRLGDSDAEVLDRWAAVFDCTARFAEHEVRRSAVQRYAYQVAERVMDALLAEMYVHQGPLDMAGAATRLLSDALGASGPGGRPGGGQRPQVRTRAFAAIRHALTRLVGHGAVERGTFGGYTLTELGTWVVRAHLCAAGHLAPVVGACAELDAGRLLRALQGFGPRDRLAEFDLWRARRGESAAARELLAAAGRMPPEGRHLAMELLSGLDVRAEEGVRGHAAGAAGPCCRAWLAANGLEPEEVFTDCDRAWLLVDELVAAARTGGSERFVERIPGLLPPARHALLPRIPQLAHPDGAHALGLAFELHPDPGVAAVAGSLLGLHGEAGRDTPGPC